MIAKEKWTSEQIHHHRYHNTRLVCQACERKGCTSYDHEQYRCKACFTLKGRSKFGATMIKEWNRAQRDKAQYTLVCLECKTKEDGIVSRLKAKDARLCTCKQPMGHSDKCKAGPFGHSGSNKGVTREELRFISFRERHVCESINSQYIYIYIIYPFI